MRDISSDQVLHVFYFLGQIWLYLVISLSIVWILITVHSKLNVGQDFKKYVGNNRDRVDR